MRVMTSISKASRARESSSVVPCDRPWTLSRSREPLLGLTRNSSFSSIRRRRRWPAPTVKRGRIGLRVFGRNEQRSAISTVDARASGMSANNTAISARVLKR